MGGPSLRMTRRRRPEETPLRGGTTWDFLGGTPDGYPQGARLGTPPRVIPRGTPGVLPGFPRGPPWEVKRGVVKETITLFYD